jgi:hypothetical protein
MREEQAQPHKRGDSGCDIRRGGTVLISTLISIPWGHLCDWVGRLAQSPDNLHILYQLNEIKSCNIPMYQQSNQQQRKG